MIIGTLKVTNIDFFTQKSSLPTFPISSSGHSAADLHFCFRICKQADFLQILSLLFYDFHFGGTGRLNFEKIAKGKLENILDGPCVS